MAEVRTIEAGRETIAVHKDLRIPMRDGVSLVADAYRGTEEHPRPALVALSPYGKELQALALTIPPQRRPARCGTAASRQATSPAWWPTTTST